MLSLAAEALNALAMAGLPKLRAGAAWWSPKGLVMPTADWHIRSFSLILCLRLVGSYMRAALPFLSEDRLMQGGTFYAETTSPSLESSSLEQQCGDELVDPL